MKHICRILILASIIGCGKNKVVEGVKGTDGISCYQEGRTDGVNIVCGDSVSFIPYGKDGIDGVSDLEYVVVCPDIPGPYPEVLLKLDGKYIAFLSDTKQKEQRLVVMGDGTYKTVDGRDVVFTVSGGDLICP